MDGQMERTFFDPFPDTVLVLFSKSRNSFGISPSYEVCLLQLSHKKPVCMLLQWVIKVAYPEGEKQDAASNATESPLKMEGMSDSLQMQIWYNCHI